MTATRVTHVIDITGPADRSGVWTQRVRGEVRIDNIEPRAAAIIKGLYADVDQHVFEVLNQKGKV